MINKFLQGNTDCSILLGTQLLAFAQHNQPKNLVMRTDIVSDKFGQYLITCFPPVLMILDIYASF